MMLMVVNIVILNRFWVVIVLYSVSLDMLLRDVIVRVFAVLTSARKCSTAERMRMRMGVLDRV